MIRIPQYNTTAKIPFWIAANSGNFSGAGGANPTIELSREGSTAWVAATGAIEDVGNGGYWFMPSVQDTALPGVVLVRVVGPGADILPPFEFTVCAPSWLSQLIAIPQNIASMTANSRLLAKALIPPNQQGFIQ